jgi:hypothetical protein
VFLLPLLLLAIQDRFPSGDLKGFSRSTTEHIINELETDLTVDRVSGRIVVDSEPLVGALVEVRGPGSAEKIRSARTNQAGHFRINAPPGRYKLKVTRDGFQSMIGNIVVKPGVKSRPIEIQLRFGV